MMLQLQRIYKAPINYNGLTYTSSEAAYQAQKTLDVQKRHEFTNLGPSAAKQLGRELAIRPDWDQVKLQVMEEIVRSKFLQNDYLASALVRTGYAVLVEGNYWHDDYWGVDLKTGRGENHLGEILMKIRQKLMDKLFADIYMVSNK